MTTPDDAAMRAADEAIWACGIGGYGPKVPENLRQRVAREIAKAYAPRLAAADKLAKALRAMLAGPCPEQDSTVAEILAEVAKAVDEARAALTAHEDAKEAHDA